MQQQRKVVNSGGTNELRKISMVKKLNPMEDS